ncbi:conserved hypothetical protein [Leishmania infantum JPCM5]|uniref:WW_domain_containing_protein_-_putative n=2 Tax=Leishmania infantum TaxID=5671 RepID=A0A6L0XN26_LEIIN|nr:conserved hypothetical protein [Leishmania infantum JPCM5]CAC9504960.1 WW_domain_containing_protein_-_putative [Leishmania infantum]CAM69477.1 conserved hypothetical protein [Leishmania infantum JPCM5]SUZ43420.1 WW_domain_containing_protein_-_putative [Leishmania infantum]|eukprot:XP_001470282.1 conserved hypothetical protein [Leishmania infantum JPCM5]
MPPVRTVKHETDVIVPRAGETYVADDGTVSQVLDDHIDANYEPTEEEVLEFADWIGMKLPQDSEFLWLAREGLKTPLPKEWKPCSTNDGEIYYFNFKTGESSWDHPMDSIFRQRFEQEKEKARARKSVSATSSTAANRSTSGPNSSTPSNSTSAIPQTHVMMTDTGVLRRDAGSGAAPGLSPVVTSISGGAKGVSAGNACREAKPIMHYPLQQQSRSATVTTRTTANPQSSAGSSAITAAAAGNPSRSSSGPAPKKVGAAEVSSAAPPRIVSEAERALEERVQREMQLALEAERSKIEEAHQGTMSALQSKFDKDVAELRSADAARRATSSRQEEEERERRLQQTRNMCEDNYGDELRSLEREVESYAAKLQKLEAEAARATSGNTQRAAIEAELKTALAQQRADAEADIKKQHDAAMEAAQSAHAAAMQKVRDEEQNRITAAKQAWQRKFDDEERALALQAEIERKRLEGQLKELDGKLASFAARAEASTMTATPPATGSSPPGSGESLSERLARVAAAKAAQLQDIEASAAREQSDVRTDGEAALAELAKQAQPAQQAAQLLPAGATPIGPLSRVASYSSDRSGVVTLQGGARPTSATLSVAFTQELNRIRLARGKDRQERLAKLRADREAALAATEAPSHSASAAKSRGSDTGGDTETTPKSGSGSSLTTVDELKAAHAVELEAKKALYAKMEEDLKQRYACEAADAAGATTAMQQSALVAKAVDTEMDLYIRQATARYDRMRAEAAAKRDKALADHQLAMEAYERRKLEAETRQAREQQEAQEAFIQSRLGTAVAAERTKLAADHAAAMARLDARYDEERDAVKAEVEEEMAAYVAAVQQEMKTSASATAASGDKVQGAAAPSATADTREGTAATEALCSQVEKQHADRQAEWSSRKRIQAAQRAALEEKQATLQAQKLRAEQHVEALKEEVTDLVAAVQAAEARQPSPSSPSTPSRSPPASTLASAATVGGHLRSMHEASMQALEQGYRSQEAALEAELQTWRGKIRALQQSQLQQSYASTSLSTPRQQVLTDIAHLGSAAMRPTSSYVLHRHPSPIATAAAGASLLNTPTISMSLQDSPWQPTTRAGLPTLQAEMMACGPSLTTGVPGTTEAILSYQQRQRVLQQRQASLEAAREAWQLHRRRKAELQQQEQSRLNLSALAAASQQDQKHEGAEPSILGAVGGVHRSRQELLSLVLSRLIERLDAVTGQAVQLQHQHQHQRYSRSQSATRADVRTETAPSPHARAHSAHSHHCDARGPPKRGSVVPMTALQPRHSTLMNAAAAASSAKVAPSTKPSSFSGRAKASQSVQHSRRGNSAGGAEGETRRGGASPGNVSSKWSMLLSQHHRHRSG